MTPYFFHEAAETELTETIDYYESCEEGLGLRFSEEVFCAIQRICTHPLAWEEMDSLTRRCLTDTFPYGVLYRISDDHIRIMAIMHLRRKPDYWTSRE